MRITNLEAFEVRSMIARKRVKKHPLGFAIFLFFRDAWIA
jgi:hypothetical protein